ncbi:sugar transferase [Paenirhodobacter sp.]|uniref:sugar transferase n=1 Tax=Paenirhodobacter sp. TaxID=1965326 RepID=UPI003B3F23F4
MIFKDQDINTFLGVFCMRAIFYRHGGDLIREDAMDSLQNVAVEFPAHIQPSGNTLVYVEHDISSFHGPPSTSLAAGPSGYYNRTGKRILDILISALLLMTFAPLIVFLLLMASRDGGPAIFSHRRIGQNGQPFNCHKIRSMVVDAEQRLADILRRDSRAAAEWAATHKLTDDPRTTRFGRLIRKTSLDELPQLWNVLLGDMSLVGPRPIVQEEVARYGAAIGHYARVRPGITGLWQVSGRNDLSYDERVALDVDYTQSISLARDLRILAMTAWSVLCRTGR